MTTHIITRDVDGQRRRYYGGFTDEQFSSLPYIKERGCVPSGWHVYHLEADEMKDRYSKRHLAVMAMPVVMNYEAAPGAGIFARDAAYDLAQELRRAKDEEQQRPCSFTYHGDDDAPPPLGHRATGRYWHDSHRRYVVFNGYVCDMHAEDIEGLRWR